MGELCLGFGSTDTGTSDEAHDLAEIEPHDTRVQLVDPEMASSGPAVNGLRGYVETRGNSAGLKELRTGSGRVCRVFFGCLHDEDDQMRAIEPCHSDLAPYKNPYFRRGLLSNHGQVIPQPFEDFTPETFANMRRSHLEIFDFL